MNLSGIIDKIWNDVPLLKEEEVYLRKMLSSEEGKRAFYEKIEGLWDGFETDDKFDSQAVLQKIRGQKSKSAKQGLMRVKTISIGRLLPYAVAVVAVGIFVWAGTRIFTREERAMTVMVTDNVELVFSDGKRVVLDEALPADHELPEGFAIVRDTVNGSKLAYSDVKKKDELRFAYVTLNVPKGGTYQMELPDGTMVFMNSCSSLRFPEHFKKGVREVYLSGEAAFAVKADKSAPFHVHTVQRTVTVTGTTFNVSAYDDDPQWKTTLFEGKVEVSGDNERVVLSPYQQYSLNKKSGDSYLKNVSVDEAFFASWMSGVSSFKAVVLEDMMRQLQRWYDISVTYEDDNARQKRFTAIWNRDESIETFLSLIDGTTDVRFKVEGKQITIFTARQN